MTTQTWQAAKPAANAQVKLKFSQKLPIFSAALGAGCTVAAVTGYLAYFWTDVAKIPAAAAGAFLVAARLWDALCTPAAGWLCEHVKTDSDRGRYHPWLFFCVPTALFCVLTFTAVPGLNTAVQAVFSLLSCLLLIGCGNLWQIPFHGLAANLTTDPDSRLSAAAFRSAGFFLGALAVTAAVFPVCLAGKWGSAALRFFLTALVLSAVSVPLGLWQYWGTWDRAFLTAPWPDLRETAGALRGGGTFWRCLAAVLLCGLAAGCAVARVYFWTYNCGNPGMAAGNAAVRLVGCLLGAVFAGIFAGLTASKGTLASAGWLISALADFVAGLAGIGGASSNLALAALQILTLLSGFGHGFAVTAMCGILPDLTEYIQQRSGARAPALLASLPVFAYKLGAATGTAAFPLVIARLGYEPGGAQNGAVLAANNCFLTFIPAVCLFLAAMCMLRYRLDRDSFHRLLEELSGRAAYSRHT